MAISAPMISAEILHYVCRMADELRFRNLKAAQCKASLWNKDGHISIVPHIGLESA